MDITIDLPFPISVNAIWRGAGRHVYRSKRYEAWIAAAWACWLQQKAACAVKSIKGYYAITIILNAPDKRQRDMGNCEKVLSDFLQSAGIIENDYLCMDQRIVWGPKEAAPYGARMVLKPFDNPQD